MKPGQYLHIKLHLRMSNQVGIASRAKSLVIFGLLGALEGLQDGDNLLQCSDLLLHLGIDLTLVLTELRIEVLAVWGCGHRGGEDGLDHERVVGLEGIAVGTAEGDRELIGGVVDVVTECLHSEVEASIGECAN